MRLTKKIAIQTASVHLKKAWASRMADDLKEREEKRREAHWDPVARWKVLQDTITWAEAQSTVQRNNPDRRLAEQARKLAQTNKNHSRYA